MDAPLALHKVGVLLLVVAAATAMLTLGEAVADLGFETRLLVLVSSGLAALGLLTYAAGTTWAMIRRGRQPARPD